LWRAVYVDEVVKPEHAALQSRSIADLAREQGKAPADVLLDLALDEDLVTRFRWRTESPEWAAAVGEAQLDARMIVGTSDGGAHLARDDGADWSSYFLRSWVLDRRVWTLEEGIRQITQVPAALLGFPDRGVLAAGRPADLMIFDPDTVGPWKKEFVHDLPGGVGRFKAWGHGVHATVVNGVPIVVDGELTGRLPGQVVRPGVVAP
jgi:N-acyl-D-aspartate/D-glutamate deacylase